jgi:exosortase
VVGSLGVLFAGALGAEVFLSRISLLGVLAGSVVFLYGWARLRVVAFPLAFLLLMIPIPAILFNHLTLPLQLIASQLGERIVSACQIPVLREGNILVLPSTRLEVVEACSGIRSLMSLLTLGIVFCYFADSRPAVRVAVTAATIPIAIGTNGLRVAGTGVAAQYVGPEAAEGFFHTFSGWLVFLAAFAMMVLLHRAIVAIWPASRVEGSIR